MRKLSTAFPAASLESVKVPALSLLLENPIFESLWMSKKLNLDTMSVDEMWQLHEEIIRVLSARLNSEKRQLEKRLLQLQREIPRSDKLDNDAPRERRRYPRVFPKYRNSKAPFETWSGRGKKPRWLTSALKAGHTIDEFAIGNLEPSRTPIRRKREELV